MYENEPDWYYPYFDGYTGPYYNQFNMQASKNSRGRGPRAKGKLGYQSNVHDDYCDSCTKFGGSDVGDCLNWADEQYYKDTRDLGFVPRVAGNLVYYSRVPFRKETYIPWLRGNMFALLGLIGLQVGVYTGLQKRLDREIGYRKGTPSNPRVLPQGSDSGSGLPVAAEYNPKPQTQSPARPAASDSPTMRSTETTNQPNVVYDPGFQATVSQSYPMAMSEGFVLRNGGGSGVMSGLRSRKKRRKRFR